MALIAKSGTPSLATALPCAANQVGSGLRAGEAIAAGDSCYIKGADGLVWRSNGTGANEAARCDGLAAKAAAAGEAVTLYTDVEFHYGSGLTPGAPYYVGATAGRLDTAPTTGGITPVAFAVDATRIRVVANRAQSDAVMTQGAAVADLGAVTVGADIAAFTDPPSAAEMAALRTFVNALKADVVANRAKINALLDSLQAAGVIAP